MSGDIRVCFEILRNAVQNKIDFLRQYLPPTLSSGKKVHTTHESKSNEKLDDSKLKISYDEVNKVILEMFESKIVKIVKKLPRSHIIILEQLFYHLQKHMTEELHREVLVSE